MYHVLLDINVIIRNIHCFYLYLEARISICFNTQKNERNKSVVYLLSKFFLLLLNEFEWMLIKHLLNILKTFLMYIKRKEKKLKLTLSMSS